MKIKTKVAIKFIAGIFIISLVLANFSYAHASYSAGTIVSMTNSARAQNGLGSLTTNSQLTSAAYSKANDMLNDDYFAHTSPDGQTPWDFINSAGYSYAYAGENLAIGYADASELFSAWLNSPTHRDNILNPNFREIGVAVVSGEFHGSETLVVVQEFGAAQETQVASENETPANTSGETPAPTNTSTQTPTQTSAKQFSFIKEKTNVSPQTLFAGEEVVFTATITGDIQTLEAHLFDKKYSLLESGSVTGDKEKTYTIRQKLETAGTSEAEIVAVDKYGNRENFALGKVTVNQKVISKAETQNKPTLLAGFKDSLKNYWVIYVVGFSALALSILTYLVWRKTGFQKQKLMASFRF